MTTNAESDTESTEDDGQSEKKTLHVRIEPTESFHERVVDRLTGIDDGRREPFEDRYGLSFSDFDALSRVFSPKNMELVQAISEHEPESIRETARLVDRFSNEVRRDLDELETLGIIEFEEHGQSKRPTVFYDEIAVTVPAPLARSGEDSDTEPTVA